MLGQLIEFVANIGNSTQELNKAPATISETEYIPIRTHTKKRNLQLPNYPPPDPTKRKRNNLKAYFYSFRRYFFFLLGDTAY